MARPLSYRLSISNARLCGAARFSSKSRHRRSTQATWGTLLRRSRPSSRACPVGISRASSSRAAETSGTARKSGGSGAGLGVKKDESHAQYVRNPAGLALGKARQPVDGEASAVGVPYLVSWKALVDAADIQRGETVQITGVLPEPSAKRPHKLPTGWVRQ